MNILRFMLLLSILIAGCNKSYMLSPEQKILFQVDITNLGTEYSHFGYFIDSDGRILSYTNPYKWSSSNQNSTLTSDQVEENLSMCIPSGKVLQSDLVKFSSYIDNIASSRVSALRKSDEKYSVKYICYRYSAIDFTYKAYIIKVEGDYSGENLNFYTKKLVTWMRDINVSLLLKNSPVTL